MIMICKNCTIDKPLEEFYSIKRKSGTYKRGTCKKCDLKKMSAASKASRRDASKRSRWILEDSTKSDRAAGLVNNLDKAYIDGMLVKDCCSYCGEDRLKLVLDRIDNTLGHVKGNVNLSCIRCNDIRNDIPFDAWKCLITGMRVARNNGHFESWRNERYIPKCERCGKIDDLHRAADNFTKDWVGYRVWCSDCAKMDFTDCICSFCEFRKYGRSMTTDCLIPRFA